MSTLRPLSPLLSNPLAKGDPEMFEIIEQEKRRQRDSLALIPSEVGALWSLARICKLATHSALL
jgi:glycine/serine hydroxymethyltransferase